MANGSVRKGSFDRICDLSGQRFPAEEVVKNWKGQYVHRDDYEERHPQQSVRGVTDKQFVKNPRPRPAVITELQSDQTSTSTCTANIESTVIALDAGSLKLLTSMDITATGDISSLKDYMTVYTSTDGATYTEIDVLQKMGAFDDFTSGSELNVVIGKAAQYAELRCKNPTTTGTVYVSDADLNGTSANQTTGSDL